MPSITNIQIPAGDSVLDFPATTSEFMTADASISRTVGNGLNSLSPSDTLTMGIDYSLDGGTTFIEIDNTTFLGGVIIAKDGSTLSREEIQVSRGQPFPVGTIFRLRTVATSAVHISGSLDFS